VLRSTTLPKLTCSACFAEKLKGALHRRTQHDYKPGEPILLDLCGPFRTVGHDGSKYFVTFVDIATRYAFVLAITKRTEVISQIRNVLQQITAHFGKPPIIFTSDNAGEYQSHEAAKFYGDLNVQERPITPHNPRKTG